MSGFDKSRLKLTRTLCLIPSDFERPTLDMGNDGNGGVGDDDELGGLFSQFAVFHPTLDIMAKHPSIVIGYNA